jgi:hypothetical protein
MIYSYSITTFLYCCVRILHNSNFFLIGIVWWSPTVSTGHCGHQWPILPVPGDYYDGENGGMIGRGNRSTRRKPVLVTLCPPQTPHAARTQTRAAAVGSQCLTAWATARPSKGRFSGSTVLAWSKYATIRHQRIERYAAKIPRNVMK